MSTPPPDAECNPPLSGVEFGLGVFLLVGTLISFLPQHIKIIRMKSHVGLSLETAILGAVNTSAALVNYIGVEYYEMFDCCEGITGAECFGKVMPFLQLVVAYLCSAAIALLYLGYFDRSWCEQNNMNPAHIWKLSWRIVLGCFVLQALFFLIYGIFAATDGVYGSKTFIYGR